MELYTYTGAPLCDAHPTPELARLLDRRNALIEMAHGAAPAAVVIGVPHHAARGVEWIADDRPEGRRVADENAALYALVCFATLCEREVPCRLVVAAHATDHDPNKIAESPYCARLLSQRGTRLMLECHTSGPGAPHGLELSAGLNRQARPLRFGQLLIGALGDGHRVAVQASFGSDAAVVLEPDGRTHESKLRYPALKTRSLVEAGNRGVAALHIEAGARFRSRADGAPTLPDDGVRLGRSLAHSIAAYLRDATG